MMLRQYRQCQYNVMASYLVELAMSSCLSSSTWNAGITHRYFTVIEPFLNQLRIWQLCEQRR